MITEYTFTSHKHEYRLKYIYFPNLTYYEKGKYIYIYTPPNRIPHSPPPKHVLMNSTCRLPEITKRTKTHTK